MLVLNTGGSADDVVFLMQKHERSPVRAERGGGGHGELTPHCRSKEAESDMIQMVSD